jgi:sugar (pentulose or hexulose) kinase
LYPAIDRKEWVLGGSCSNVTRALDWFLASSVYNFDGTIRWREVREDLSQAFSKPAPNRPFFLPYLYGERAPVWEPDLSGVWIGLRGWTKAADLLYGVVEGICFSLRNVLEAYADMGLKVSLICSSGGLNQLGIQKLRASLYGRPIRLVRGADPTSFAAAAITLHCIGELSEPREATAWLELEADVEPEPDWQLLLDDRFGLFTRHTQQFVSELRSPSGKLSASAS